MAVVRSRTFRLLLACAAAGSPAIASAQSGVMLMDARSFVRLWVDELEIADPSGDRDPVWDINLSVGGDLHKFWFKSEGERGDSGDDRTELQFLYSHAVLPFWDFQAGVRRDLDPGQNRNWAVAAVQGLAPYFFDVETEFMLAEGGQSSLRAKAEYELLLTQRLILTPELEFIAYGRNEPSRLIGSGLSRVEFDLRLRYEIKREIAPYVGIGWYRQYGSTRDLAAAAGHDADDVRLLVGLRGWF